MKRHRTGHRGCSTWSPACLLLAFGLVLVAQLTAASGARAFETRTPLGTFGTDGTSGTIFGSGETSLGQPGDLAIDQAGDKLYAISGTSFTPNSIHAFGLPGHTPGGGVFPLSLTDRAFTIAVDNTMGASAGNIYYSSSLAGSGSLSGLTSSGAPRGGKFPIEGFDNPRGVAVDPSGNVWVVEKSFTHTIRKYDSAGNAIGTLTLSQGRPEDVAFDSNGDLYVAISNTNSAAPGIWRLTSAGNYKTATQITPLISSGGTMLAVDRSTHRLYAADSNTSGSGNPDPGTLASEGVVTVYDAAGNQLEAFGVPGDGLGGIAIDEGDGRVYLSDSDDHRVHVLGAKASFPDATATAQAATGVEATTAELNATINDNSVLPTDWKFQVSDDGGASWETDCPKFGSATEGDQSGVSVSCEVRALLSNTEYLFRVITSKGPGSSPVTSSPLSFETDEIPPAGATVGPAGNVTVDSADFGATVDDNGPRSTAWHFEVSDDGGAVWRTPQGEVSGETGGGESGVAVAATAEGLEPCVTYAFRIVTKKDPGAPDVPFKGPSTFTTTCVPPSVSSVGAAAITDTSAYLAGEVDPHNLQTTYSFEYGPTPALGSQTPASALAAAHESLTVFYKLTGLTSNSDYYLKLVAENAKGTSESGVVHFRTRAEAPPLPEQRAYEQVTPVEKNYSSVRSGLAVAWDGDALAFNMVTGIAEPAGQIGNIETHFLSTRSASGWRTRWPNEPACLSDPSTSVGGSDTQVRGFSANLDHAVIARYEGGSCPYPALDPAAPQPGNNLYVGDFSSEPAGYRLLTPESVPGLELRLPSGIYRDASEDFSHVVYASPGQQTPDAPGGNFEKLFDWHEGTLSLVSKDTSNVAFATDSYTPEMALNGVSADGNRVFFQNPISGSAEELYMRQNGSKTYDVSESECTSACGESAADVFRWATPAGNKALFTSKAKLLNEDNAGEGGDLYLYAQSANPPVNKNLTLLSKDSEPADGTKAGVLGVLGMSDDGNTVFFVAEGQLVAGGDTEAGPKVYRWRSGGSPGLQYLATLDGGSPGLASGDVLNWSTGVEGGPARPGSRAVTPDGGYLLIHTTERLDRPADHDGDEDVYRWDEAQGWQCLSCQLPGVASKGASTFQGPTIVGARVNGLANKMSEDGSRVFFESRDSLVPQDTNEGAPDVYEWHEGTIGMISSGAAPQGAKLVGADRSGDNVFFLTAERLVGWDTDGETDVYDARVGGGFPEPPPEPVPCEGESCRGASTVAATPTGAGTAAFEGPGNRPAGGKQGRCPKGKREVRRKGRTRCVKQHKPRHRHHRRAAGHDRRGNR